MMPNYTRAAISAAETLIRHGVTHFPLSPLPILEKMVTVMSFSDLSEKTGIRRLELLPVFGKNQDAFVSVCDGVYVVAYNALLPFTMIQKALAREMGHIVLGHKEHSETANAEAHCFAYHLLCPRPLIHAIQASCLRVSTDLIANLTGMFDQSIVAMRRIPGTDVPTKLNGFVRNQIMPFVLNFFDFYQRTLPPDGSAIADLGTYMDGYKEG